MEISDLRSKTSDDLSELKASMTKDLFSYKMKNSIGQLEDTSLPGKVRKDLARIEQILTERSRAPEASAAEGDKA